MVPLRVTGLNTSVGSFGGPEAGGRVGMLGSDPRGGTGAWLTGGTLPGGVTDGSDAIGVGDGAVSTGPAPQPVSASAAASVTTGTSGVRRMAVRRSGSDRRSGAGALDAGT